MWGTGEGARAPVQLTKDVAVGSTSVAHPIWGVWGCRLDLTVVIIAGHLISPHFMPSQNIYLYVIVITY